MTKQIGGYLDGIIAVAMLVLILSPHVAFAWNIEEHEAITTELIFDRSSDTGKLSWGWLNEPMADRVIHSNAATDLADMPSVIGAYYPTENAYKPEVVSLISFASFNTAGSNGFHFDNLFRYDDINLRMHDLNDWMNGRVDALSADCSAWDANEPKFLTLLGIISHSIQDFYCHSDYVGLCDEYTNSEEFVASEYPTWDELQQNTYVPSTFKISKALATLKESNDEESEWVDQDGLQTGKWVSGPYNLLLRWLDPRWYFWFVWTEPWYHRHAEEEEQQVGFYLGRRATAQWWYRALMRLPCSLRKRFLAHIRTQTVSTPPPPVDRSKLVIGLRACAGLKTGDWVRVLLVGGASDVRTSFGFKVAGDEPVGIHQEVSSCPAYNVIATSSAIESIMNAADPAAAAAAAEASGDLVCAPGGPCSPSLPQSTFIDGTQGGIDCGTAPCWPGKRGDATAHGVFDNVNSPLGDSIVVKLDDSRGMNSTGLNWRLGYHARTGLLDQSNPLYNAAYDVPRVIFRLFDPATSSWSPLDSAELYADQAAAVAGTMLNIGGFFRFDWPPSDKLAAGANLPNGFAVAGKTAYSELAFLPRGTKLQYQFKTVEDDGTALYGLTELSTHPVAIVSGSSFDDVDDGGETHPAGPRREPALFTFAVLPGVWAAGSSSSIDSGRTATPLLIVDGGHLHWRSGGSPEARALRSMCIRADLFRLINAGLHRGNSIGGHERSGIPAAHPTNFFPNAEDWSLDDSLAAWYRLIIVDSGDRPAVREGSDEIVEDSDARVLSDWWSAPTGIGGGDRCLLGMGNGLGDGLLNSTPSVPTGGQTTFANGVLGVSAVSPRWNGADGNESPSIIDAFASTVTGPGQSFSYMLDGGSHTKDKFDAFSAFWGQSPHASATYPQFAGSIDQAGVSQMTEPESSPDGDKNKALSYGFSLDMVSQGGMQLESARDQILYKFLTGCRGARGASDTASCWPCPSDVNKYGNWSTSGSFQTEGYGPLYPIQDVCYSQSGVGLPGAATFGKVLFQNRPNPFNPATVIPYSLDMPGHVTIRIYGISGRCIRTLVDAVQMPGARRVTWDGRLDSGDHASSGVYFYRITYPDGSTSMKKMTILR